MAQKRWMDLYFHWHDFYTIRKTLGEEFRMIYNPLKADLQQKSP